MTSSCAVCGIATRLGCAGCRAKRYCSRRCQRLDWPRHRVTECSGPWHVGVELPEVDEPNPPLYPVSYSLEDIQAMIGASLSRVANEANQRTYRCTGDDSTIILSPATWNDLVSFQLPHHPCIVGVHGVGISQPTHTTKENPNNDGLTLKLQMTKGGIQALCMTNVLRTKWQHLSHHDLRGYHRWIWLASHTSFWQR